MCVQVCGCERVKGQGEGGGGREEGGPGSTWVLLVSSIFFSDNFSPQCVCARLWHANV